jgi:hypothetical protein
MGLVAASIDEAEEVDFAETLSEKETVPFFRIFKFVLQ